MPAVELTNSAASRTSGGTRGGQYGEAFDVAAVGVDLLTGETPMTLAMAGLPGHDFHFCLARDMQGEILVGQEDHFVGAKRFHHLYRIAGSAADIGFGFHLG